MPRSFALAVVAVVLAGCATAPLAQPSPSAVAVATPPPTATPRPTATPQPSPTDAPSPTPTETPVTYATLDGMPADPSVATRLPIAVMIDDNVVARPQSGFNAASIVYQAPADGGEDRYMLVFQELDAPDIGPVRSGRPYFVYWAAEDRAGFGHYGGDAKTLGTVIPGANGTLIYNLDAMFGSGKAYHRISSRKAPHNGYTSTPSLRSVAAAKRYPTEAVATEQRLFKDDAGAGDRPSGGSITVPYNRGASGYAYDPATNSYLRSVAGKAQIDASGGKRVTARNVVVLFMHLHYDPESEAGHRRPMLDQIGEGTAWVFRDGTVVKGAWRKANQGGLTRFYDAEGAEIALNRGRTFVQVVDIGTKVAFDAAAG
jgi:DUF3048 family protein